MKKIVFAAFLLVTNLAIAQMPDLSKGTYVTDLAHVLTADQVSALNQHLAQIEKETSLQLVIVLVDKLPQGINIDNFMNAVDVKWQQGNNNVNNERLIYVAGIQQQMHRLVAIRGVSSIVKFNEKKCTEILAAMKPYYNNKDYNGGLQVLVSSVASTLSVTLQAPSSGISARIVYALAVIAIVILIGLFLRSRGKKQATV